jgi:hypothetical protein
MVKTLVRSFQEPLPKPPPKGSGKYQRHAILTRLALIWLSVIRKQLVSLIWRLIITASFIIAAIVA